MAVTVTYDLEDHRASPSQPVRYGMMTHRLLAALDEMGAQATVFVVGELARAEPALVREIAAAGHEIALHGWRHVPFPEVGRGALGPELRRGRELLEDIVGGAVHGVRAPIFSLTPASSWAVEEIHAAGFAYSSSVLPSANPLNGWPGAPREPFRWPNGLIELPCPLLGAGRVQMPFLGGVYLRYLPRPVIAAAAARLKDGAAPWTYFHPYDLDAEEPFFVLPWAGWLTSRIVLARRGATLDRIRDAVAAGGGPGRPLAELAQRAVNAPVFAFS